jgi:ferredoxin
MTDEVQTQLHVKVDAAKCCGYTVCADVCPEIYKLDEDGFAHVESDLVPLGLEEKAKAGAAACPEAAITVE